MVVIISKARSISIKSMVMKISKANRHQIDGDNNLKWPYMKIYGGENSQKTINENLWW